MCQASSGNGVACYHVASGRDLRRETWVATGMILGEENATGDDDLGSSELSCRLLLEERLRTGKLRSTNGEFTPVRDGCNRQVWGEIPEALLLGFRDGR